MCGEEGRVWRLRVSVCVCMRMCSSLALPDCPPPKECMGVIDTVL